MRSWPELEERGWRRERAVVMVARGSGPGAVPPRAPRRREIGAATLAAFQQLAFADDAAVDRDLRSELPARLATAQAVLRGRDRVAGVRRRRGSEGGLPASTATLYLDPDVEAGGSRSSIRWRRCRRTGSGDWPAR